MSWSRSRSGWASARRMPRTPRNGFASGGWGRYGSGLSPPTSSVRSVIRAPCAASTSARYAATCSSTSGARSRPRNRNSVRTSPTTSAPLPTPAVISAGVAPLTPTSTCTPSRVLAGSPASASARSYAARSSLRRRRVASRTSARRVDVQLAGRPVERDGRAVDHVEHRAAGADHGRDPAGSGQDRAVRGRAGPGQHDAVDRGRVERRRLGRGEVGGHQDAVAGQHGARPAPSSCRRTWSATARTSAARARRYGSSSAASAASAVAAARCVRRRPPTGRRRSRARPRRAPRGRRRSRRCASKIAASSAETMRRGPVAVGLDRRADVRERLGAAGVRSAAGSAPGASGTTSAAGRTGRAGPIAMPGDAGERRPGAADASPAALGAVPGQRPASRAADARRTPGWRGRARDPPQPGRPGRSR